MGGVVVLSWAGGHRVIQRLAVLVMKAVVGSDVRRAFDSAQCVVVSIVRSCGRLVLQFHVVDCNRVLRLRGCGGRDRIC
jgi:hypothetical protein